MILMEILLFLLLGGINWGFYLFYCGFELLDVFYWRLGYFGLRSVIDYWGWRVCLVRCLVFILMLVGSEVTIMHQFTEKGWYVV